MFSGESHRSRNRHADKLHYPFANLSGRGLLSTTKTSSQEPTYLDLIRSGAAVVWLAVCHVYQLGPFTFASKLMRQGLGEESLYQSIIGQWRVIRALTRGPIRILTRCCPALLSRYVSLNLAVSFPKRIRRDILIYHYQFLASRTSARFFSAICNGNAVLWQQPIGETQGVIRLAFTGMTHYDGDLQLTFYADGEPLYQIAFTIVPGNLLGAATSNVLLVARVQGVRGKLLAMRTATKACRDIALAHLLVAAAQGVASALGISVIAGVGSNQRVRKDGVDSKVLFDYDAFWTTYSCTEKAGIYLINVPFEDKPLDQLKRDHRRRARIRRDFKAEITRSVQDRFSSEFLLL